LEEAQRASAAQRTQFLAFQSKFCLQISQKDCTPGVGQGLAVG
jgi:hypothetical protein